MEKWDPLLLKDFSISKNADLERLRNLLVVLSDTVKEVISGMERIVTIDFPKKNVLDGEALSQVTLSAYGLHSKNELIH